MSILAELAEDRAIAVNVDCPGCRAKAGIDCYPNEPRIGPCLGRLWKAEKGNEMASKPRGRPAKTNSQAEQLQAALSFISCASDDHDFWHKHVRLSGNFAIAFNGQMAAGHPIAEDLECCPHLERFQAAIAKCGKSLAITQTAGGKLSIKGDKLNALVDCLPAEDMPFVQPDAPVGQIGDVFKEAFRVCSTLASEAADEVLKASLLLEANVCTGTNRHALLQYYHGINMPPNMVLPKAFAMAVARQTKALTGFGFEWFNDACVKVRKVTFHFEGGAWISTLCYSDDWPSTAKVWEAQAFPGEIPAGLFEGIAAVADFNEKGWITFGQGKVQSHRSDQHGAQYDVPGLQPGKQFAGKLLGQVAPFAKTVDLTTFSDRLYFFGGEAPNYIRGAVMGIVENSEGPEGVNNLQPEPEADDEPEAEQPTQTGW